MDLHGVPSLDFTQNGLDLGDEWEQISQAIARRHHHNDGYTGRREVLLMTEIPVNREKNLNPGTRHEREQLAVLLPSPIHLLNGADIVPRRFATERPGNTFVK